MRRAALAVVALAFLFGASAGVAVAATPFTVADAPASLRQTSWSPDGRWIAYVDERLHYSLSVVAPDGSSWRPVSDPVFDPVQWSPDGRRVLWTSYQRIGVAEVATATVREWAVQLDPYAPPWIRWSPDGEQIVFQSGYYWDGSVVVSALDGSARRELATGGYPEWSPDGQEIAFLTSYPDPLGVQAIRSDGTKRRLVVDTISQVVPRWSPMGDRIAYLDDYSQLFVVKRNGSGVRLLGTVGGRQLSWSPDGAWLAVGGDLIEVDGPGRAHFDTDSWVAARWSPSGREILYARDGRLFAGSTLGLERSVAEGFGADWSPDGRQISFLRAPYDRPMPFDHCFARVYVIGADSHQRPVSTCRLVGSDRRDAILGTAGPDEVFARRGHDVVSAGAGADRLSGGRGRDRLFGGPGDDELLGGPGNDRLAAADGEADELSCGPGRDVAKVDAADLVSSDCEVVHR